MKCILLCLLLSIFGFCEPHGDIVSPPPDGMDVAVQQYLALRAISLQISSMVVREYPKQSYLVSVDYTFISTGMSTPDKATQNLIAQPVSGGWQIVPANKDRLKILGIKDE